MFLCRERELKKLNYRYESNTLECVIIYGRRRVGKTALIKEFVKNKPVIFFSALRAAANDNLEALSKVIHNFHHPNAESAPNYSSFDNAFSAITDIARLQERVVFVIDELPYLVDADKSILSRLQHLMDHDWKESRLFVILCGSSISFMEKEVLSDKSPLFGRRTAQMKIEPLSYLDAARFHPELSPEENALIYGITGGIPHYINKLDVHGSIKDALLNNLFDPYSYLYEEPENLLKQELREPAVYNSIIRAIANGASRLSEISDKVRIESSLCISYLKVLSELGIVSRIEPAVDKTRKKTIYRITDNFFRFWYRFIPSSMLQIQIGSMEKAYDAAVGSYLSDYMGQVFEDICRQYLVRYADDLPFIIGEIGEWWGTHPLLKKEAQMDIVAVELRSNNVTGGEKYIIGSCKYRNEKIGPEEFDLIRDYSSVFTKADDERFYYIFSKSGFRDSLYALQKNQKIKLITIDTVYSVNYPRLKSQA